MTWQTSVLQGLNAPTSQNNINKMTAWNLAEGNRSYIPGVQGSGLPINNPFNATVQQWQGVNYPYSATVNSAGVRFYTNLNVGIAANVAMIGTMTAYTGILNNLRNDGPTSTFANAVGGSPWGTSGSDLTSVLQQYGWYSTQPGPGGKQAAAQTNNGYTPSAGQVTFTYAQLEGIWISAGGNPQNAAMAAAIAMAESGGNSQASNSNTNGTIDRGLWQINSSNGSGSSFDIMTNARTAVSMSQNGSNWRPWCTAYSDGACGTQGGCYLCQGAPYQKFLNTSVQPATNVPLNATAGMTPATTQSSGNSSTGAGAPQAQDAFSLGQIAQWGFCAAQPLACIAEQGGGGAIDTAINNAITRAIFGIIVSVLNPMIQFTAGIMGMVAGGGIMIFGFYSVATQTQAGKSVAGIGKQVGGAAVMAVAPEAAPEVYASDKGVTTVQRTRGRRGLQIAGINTGIGQRGSQTQTSRVRYPQQVQYTGGRRGTTTMQYTYGAQGTQVATTRTPPPVKAQLNNQARQYAPPQQQAGPSASTIRRQNRRLQAMSAHPTGQKTP